MKRLKIVEVVTLVLFVILVLLGILLHSDFSFDNTYLPSDTPISSNISVSFDGDGI